MPQTGFKHKQGWVMRTEWALALLVDEEEASPWVGKMNRGWGRWQNTRAGWWRHVGMVTKIHEQEPGMAKRAQSKVRTMRRQAAWTEQPFPSTWSSLFLAQSLLYSSCFVPNHFFLETAQSLLALTRGFKTPPPRGKENSAPPEAIHDSVPREATISSAPLSRRSKLRPSLSSLRPHLDASSGGT